MILTIITLALLSVGTLPVRGEEKKLAIKHQASKAKSYIEPWTDLKDLEAEEDSSMRFKEVFSGPVSIRTKGSKRLKRSLDETLDLVAEEDSSQKHHKIVSKHETEDSSDKARTKRNPESWRTPRNYQFVTRSSRQDPITSPSIARSGRLIESGGRFYDDSRVTYPEYSRSHQPEINRRTNIPNRRIIYYATLPEPTRRPEYDRFLRQYERDYQDRDYERQYNYDKYYNDRYYSKPSYGQEYDRINDYYSNRYDQNYNNRQYESNYNRPSYPGYPSIRDNEITRVSSSIIDVTNKDERKERERDDPGLSKYVIIDREPPYLKDVYNFLSSFRPNNDDKYSEFIAQYNKEEVTHERNTKKPPRKQSSVPIPPVELTVFKGKPLDIRPLDISVETSSNASHKERPTSTHKPTTLNPIQEFERTYKY